jgi:hypothetical protein
MWGFFVRGKASSSYPSPYREGGQPLEPLLIFSTNKSSKELASSGPSRPSRWEGHPTHKPDYSSLCSYTSWPCALMASPTGGSRKGAKKGEAPTVVGASL